MLTSPKIVAKYESNPQFLSRVLFYRSEGTKYVLQDQIPKIALYRVLEFPEVPPQLCRLSRVEQRLVASRPEFMNISSVDRERQLGLYGMVKNLPVRTEQIVKYLLRNFLETQTIQL
ncbi:hypothetical protein LOD99_11975 [Oopsacas minuta]|uniref:Uncharacterized protein n=1 Tax=Oopsacas minuta TaxID=111878 RepID=A0AAV7JH50_9METZ|nr:hypothetical protein LOD99_11975 [Oopsacas minuta]